MWSRVPTDVTKDLPSAAIAIPASSVVPEVTCSGSPTGNRCRQMCVFSRSVNQMVGPFLSVDVMYTDFPSGDQAPEVQDPLGGPTSRGTPSPWKGTTWQGRNTPRASISTTSTEWPSGERYEWCAIPRSLGGA